MNTTSWQCPFPWLRSTTKHHSLLPTVPTGLLPSNYLFTVRLQCCCRLSTCRRKGKGKNPMAYGPAANMQRTVSICLDGPAANTLYQIAPPRWKGLPFLLPLPPSPAPSLAPRLQYDACYSRCGVQTQTTVHLQRIAKLFSQSFKVEVQSNRCLFSQSSSLCGDSLSETINSGRAEGVCTLKTCDPTITSITLNYTSKFSRLR